MTASSEYWDARYKNGGHSGMGSYGVLAQFKADVLNQFVEQNGVKTVIEFGCGDSHQLSLYKIPEYLGLDVAEAAVAMCSTRFAKDTTKRFKVVKHPIYTDETADMSMSLDVLFHLVEADVYEEYIRALFNSANKYVAIYASNYDELTAPHVRRRKFTTFIDKNISGWELFNTVNNARPASLYADGSESDFYFYRKVG